MESDGEYIEPSDIYYYERRVLFNTLGYESAQLAEEALEEYLVKNNCYESFIIVCKYRKE